MATEIKNFATNVEIDANTAAGTAICSTNSGQSRILTEFTITNTSTSVAVLVSVYKLDTADLPITTTLFNASRIIQPGKTWNVLEDVSGMVMGSSQSLYAFPLVDSIAFANAAGYEQT